MARQALLPPPRQMDDAPTTVGGVTRALEDPIEDYAQFIAEAYRVHYEEEVDVAIAAAMVAYPDESTGNIYFKDFTDEEPLALQHGSDLSLRRGLPGCPSSSRKAGRNDRLDDENVFMCNKHVQADVNTTN